MSFKWNPALLPVLVCLTAAACTPSKPTVSIEYEKYELANGLDVVLHVDRSDPVAAVAMTFHVGSSRETEGRTGFAHMFEHLFFLDSENLGPGGLDRLMTRIGSSTNGSTNRDRTNYYELVPVDGLEKALWAESDKLGWFINTVTPDVVAKERQVVKNEKRQSYDNRPYGHTNYVIDRALYPEGHPYRWQVIGSLQDLDAASLEDVKEFHHRWYGPDNATLVVAGDIDLEATKAWIERYFGEIPARATPERGAIPPVSLTGDIRLQHEDRLARLPELNRVWPSVPAYHPDEPALEILAALLTDGKASPFYRVLVQDEGVAPSADASQYGAELAGDFSLSVRAYDGTDLDSVAAAIEKAFALFESEGVDPVQLERIKASREAGFYQGLSSVLGKAFRLAQYNIFTDSPGYAQRELERLLAVSESDVMRVYNAYIKGQPSVSSSFVPVGQADLGLDGSTKAEVFEEPIVLGAEAPVAVLDRDEIARTPSLIDRSEEPPYGPSPTLKTPEVWQAQLANGVRVLGIEDDELPLVQFSLEVDGGMLVEAEDKSGVANLLAETMLDGTARRTAPELELALDLLGASLRVSAGSQGFSLSGQTLARNFRETMDLVSEVLLEPRWDPAALERARLRVVSRLQASEGEPTSIASRTFSELVYGDHRLARQVSGTIGSVETLTMDDLKSYWAEGIRPNHAALHVAGSVSQEQVLSAARSLETGWAEGDVSFPAPPSWDPARAGVYFVDVPGAVQSVVYVGSLALAETDPEFVPATFMNFRLGGGGFASELTQVLREGKGYTYGIGSSFSGSRLPGPFAISSRVRANVTYESLDEIKRIVETYGDRFSEEDLATTKNFYVRSNARAFETLGAKLGMLEAISAYGFPADYVSRQMAVMNGMTVDDVQALSARFLNPGDLIWLVVGDAATQQARLSGLGLGPARLLERQPNS